MSLKSVCSLSNEDWDFVKKLTRVAHVHVLSSQVSIYIDKSNRDIGTDNENKLIFPQNWSFQYVGIDQSKHEDNHIIRMTFEVLPLNLITKK